MKPELWNRAKQILPEARELPLEERAAFLDRACKGDAELRREVESFLATDPAALTFMEQPPIRLLEEDETALREDSQVGAYRILRRLGSGGMGIVYLATRVGDEFRREVAIKVLLESQVGQASGETERRFLQEMGILAKLNHPNIAKLHEGGRTEDGRLYYLMEYVEGEPIDVYCREKELSLEQRLRLFQKVAAAVQYAHTRLVIHRDIKPSNVLVTADGEPKLLDFGVAKPLEGAGLGATVLTGGDQKLFTPDYASPEQIAGQDIHIASDVYSLGILLYELLAGDRPYRLKGLPEQESRQKVCDETPPPPSTVTARAATTKTASEPPATDPTTASFGRHLQGDLDTIVLMALRKSPQERYATVQQLADDIERHLLGHPIQARTPSIGYRARKFVKRNRVGLGIAGLFVLVIGIAGWALFEQYRETVQERDRAQEVTKFLVEVFSAADPGQSKGLTLTAREILAAGGLKIEEEAALSPEIRAALQHTLGTVYSRLGAYDEARQHLSSALQLRRDTTKRASDLAETLTELGWLNRVTGDLEEAEGLLQEALGIYSARPLLAPEELSPVLNRLATVLRAKGSLKEAEELHRKELALLQEGGALPDENTAAALYGLGLSLTAQARYSEAEPPLREALALRERYLGEEHPDVARSLRSVGWVLYLKGDMEAAEPILRAALAKTLKILGPDHSEVATDLANLAYLLNSKGDLEAATELRREVIAIYRNSLGDNHPNVARSMITLGSLLKASGNYGEAEHIFRESLDVLQAALGPKHPHIAIAKSHLAGVLGDAGRYPEALAEITEAIPLCVEVLGPQHPHCTTLLLTKAATLRNSGDYANAIPLYESVLEERRAQYGASHEEVAAVLMGLSELQIGVEEFVQAENTAREALAIFRTALPADHWWIANTEGLLGTALAAQSRPEEAQPLLLESIRVLTEIKGAEARETKRTRDAAEFYQIPKPNSQEKEESAPEVQM